MRVLAACPACALQYDASDRAVGSRFSCVCGAQVEVREVKARDAVVVRCSSCGAPRGEGAAACRFCGSDFTVVELDCNTMCPGCYARTSDHARFCHHCGLALAPDPPAAAVDRSCPACAHRPVLHGRRVGELRHLALECLSCGGLWLAEAMLRDLVARQDGPELQLAELAARPAAGKTVAAGTPLYRPCPTCGKLMHRRNYAHASGVILDFCAAHGVWFDADELHRVLAWVRAGGPARAAERAKEEARLERRTAAILKGGADLRGLHGPAPVSLLDRIIDVMSLLL